MALKPFVFEGGVDLMTPAVLTRPGTLQACMNYEWGVRAGYSRGGGFERTDGAAITTNEGVGQFKVVRAVGASSLLTIEATVPTSGTVNFISDGEGVTLEGYVVDVERYESANDPALPDGHLFSLILVVTPSSRIGSGGVGGQFTFGGGGTSLFAINASIETLSELTGDASALNEAIAAFAALQRAAIETVPGQAGSDIIGGFWLKNRPYVLRDLRREYFTGGLYSDANEGQFLTIGASEYEVLAVTYLNGDAGFLTLSPVAGSGTDVTGAISSPAVLSITGTPPNCDATALYNEAEAGYTTLALVGGTADEWSIVDDVYVERLALDADSPGLLAQQTNAALWKADSTGWSRVELGREMQFTSGQTALGNFLRTSTLDAATVKTIGHSFATTSTLNGAAAANLNADDAAVVALSGASGDIFLALDFAAFDAIPSTAIIRGIEVKIDRTSSVGNEAKDNTVTLVGLTGGVENKARGGAWPAATAVATYGGANDLWGNASVTVAELQASTFGVLLIADRLAAGTAATGSVDYISVKVYYVERDTPAYVWNGTSDVEVTIRHVQVQGGATATNDAYGYLTISAAKNAAKTRLINVGDTIRTAASGAGDLLATVASRDAPIFFPGQTDIDNNRSQYRALVTNFFASDQLDAAYIVSGVGPCIYFDTARTIRIRSHLPVGEDNPRHVARLGEKLVLGFYSGNMQRSLPNNPFELRTEEGAGETPFGDRMTGLRMRASDQLIVACESSIQAWAGLTETSSSREIVTRERGMIEYTDADVGKVLGCDGQGVFLLEQPPTLGTAEQEYLSAAVADWLQPRLQATDNVGQSAIGPICAQGFRHKRQYRLFFEDGWFLNLAMTTPPTPMFGRYVNPSRNDEPLAIRCIFSGIDSRGRERTFASFKSAKEGYLFELDTGRSFDGDEIPAYIVTNPIPTTQGAPDSRGQFNCAFVHGTGYGVAELTYSRAPDYGTPDPDIQDDLTLGASDATASLVPKPFRGSVDFGIEGKDVTLRFDSSTDSEGPHTLQFLSLMVESRGHSLGNSRS
jgi:hypothetical protein